MGTSAPIVSGSSTEMTVTTPVHYPSDTDDVVDVKVVIFPGYCTTEDNDTVSDVFTYLFEPLDPVITGIQSRRHRRRHPVTIYGSNFYCGEGILVYFDNVSLR